MTPDVTSNPELTQLGIAGLLIFLVLKHVIYPLIVKIIDKLKPNETLTNKINEITFKINQIYDWHNVRDDTGNLVWYSRTKEMEETLKKLTSYLEASTQLLQNLLQSHNDIKTNIGKTLDKVEELSKNLAVMDAKR